MVNKMSEEKAYEVEKKRVKLYRNILEPLVIALMILGIVTASLNITFGGFTPIIWLMLAFGWVLIIICMEISMIRTFLESKK